MPVRARLAFSAMIVGGVALLAMPAAAAPQADRGRMLETIRALSTTPGGSPRTRFTLEPVMDSIGVALEGQLAVALAPAGSRGSVELFPFPVEADTCVTCGRCPTWDPARPHRTVLKNVVGLLKGRDGAHGRFLVTAHYDAIGCRTAGWQAWNQSAPGADDNGSGVAAVLELARLLALDPEYDFDVEFVLFDGEELVLLGSKALAAHEDSAGVPILGVLNMDMIGYNGDRSGDSLTVMTNFPSSYLADFMVDTERLDPQSGFGLKREVANIFFSDHGPYWDYGIAGILLIENTRIVLHNPTYHRVTDLPDQLTAQGRLAAEGANVYLKALRRLGSASGGPPDLRLSAGDAIAYVNRTPGNLAATPGDTVRVDFGVLNVGGTLEPGQEPIVGVYRIDDAGRHLVKEESLHGPLLGGAHTRVSYTFYPTSADIGAVVLEAEMTGQTARRAIAVRGSVTRIVRHYMAPNPVRDPARASLAYELSKEATVRITIIDLHGHEIGKEAYAYAGIKPAPGSGMEVGLNRIALTRLLQGVDPAPGVYLYRIELFPADGSPSESVLGKFAIVR